MRLLKIGSAPDCDIVLNSPKVSGLHAEITLLNNGDILVEDKDSRNGTFVNNQPVKPFTSISIKRGDYVRFANETLSWAMVPQLPDMSMYKEVHGIGSNMIYNDIHVSGNNVSRFHATLKIDKRGRAFIEDHSLNGTTVNGQKIMAHQNVRVKRNDAVVVGGMPVDLKHYIKPNVGQTILKSLGGVAAVAALVAILMRIIPWISKPPCEDNPKIGDLMDATACVIGEYYVDVTIKNNPLDVYLPGIMPETFRFGFQNNQWKLGLPNPCTYYGTAFFISPYGELGTNRHVAVPWEYLTKAQTTLIEMQMREQVYSIVNEHRQELQNKSFRNNLLKTVGYEDQVEDEGISVYDIVVEQLDHCTYEISGHHAYFGILLSGDYFSTVADLKSCQTIAESGTPDRDVALLRLNTPHTPDAIMKNKGWYRICNARIDETQLAMSEPLQTIGYPVGLLVGTIMGNGKELNPTLVNCSMSRKPDKDQFQMQTVAMGGQSGSPVIDKDRNLVGVLYAGIDNSELTYCCNIKHLVALYEEYKYIKQQQ